MATKARGLSCSKARNVLCLPQILQEAAGSSPCLKPFPQDYYFHTHVILSRHISQIKTSTVIVSRLPCHSDHRCNGRLLLHLLHACIRCGFAPGAYSTPQHAKASAIRHFTAYLHWSSMLWASSKITTALLRSTLVAALMQGSSR